MTQAQAMRKFYEEMEARYPKFKGKITMSALREQKELRNNNNVLEYDFRKSNSQDDSERKLEINDAFVARQIGFHLKMEQTAKPGTGILVPFVNPIQVAKAFAAADIPNAVASLEAIYAGFAKFEIEQNIIMDGLEMQRFRQVPQTQESAINDHSQFGENDGFVDIEPKLILSGETSNKLSIRYPSHSGIAVQATVAGWKAYLVCTMRGAFVPGGASFLKVAQ